MHKNIMLYKIFTLKTNGNSLQISEFHLIGGNFFRISSLLSFVTKVYSLSQLKNEIYPGDMVVLMTCYQI